MSLYTLQDTTMSLPPIVGRYLTMPIKRNAPHTPETMKILTATSVSYTHLDVYK